MRGYLARIGSRGRLASRRELTRWHVKQIATIREAKRAALKEEGRGLHVIANY